MNWGIKIMMVFSIFVAGMLFMVFKSARQNMDLVVPDYYEQELKYQDVIDASMLTHTLKGKVDCKITGNAVDIIFPEDMKGKTMKGEVWLYCVADKSRDVKKAFTVNNTSFSLPLDAHHKGAYEVKVSWQAGGESYYHQQKIFIQ